MQKKRVKIPSKRRVRQGNITLCNNLVFAVLVENYVENVNKSRFKRGFHRRLPSKNPKFSTFKNFFAYKLLNFSPHTDASRHTAGEVLHRPFDSIA